MTPAKCCTRTRVNIGVAAAVVLLLAMQAVATSPAKKQAARAQFEKAEEARQALEAKPSTERKLADYLAILKLYRNVAILAPTIHQAPESLFRTAQLNQAMAVQFPRDAAKYRQEARRTYAALLDQYPENRYRKESNQALALMEGPEEAASALTQAPAPMPPSTPALTPVAASNTSGKPVLVSNIREWSTPSYTRVVIDVDDEVKFEAGRIPNPDRIYFDLHNTKLVPALKDHSRDVEDGLLKKIRLGLNRAGITRVVLEVGQVTTYSAFLLPNPYRLVIDIQGAAKPNTVTAVAAVTPPEPPKESKLVAESKPKRKPPEQKKLADPAPEPVQSTALAPPVEAINGTGL
jgi:hypothetical protein